MNLHSPEGKNHFAGDVDIGPFMRAQPLDLKKIAAAQAASQTPEQQAINKAASAAAAAASEMRRSEDGGAITEAEAPATISAIGLDE